MFVVKIYGGLGNQIFQYIFGKYIEKKFSCDVVFDFYYFEKFNYRKPNLLKIVKNVDTLSDYDIHRKFNPTNSFKINSIWNSVYNRGSFINERIFNNLKFNSFNNDNLYYFDGYWQDKEYFNFFSSNELDSFFAFGDSNSIINVIGIHVRRGDYLKAPNDKIFYTQSIEYYKSSIGFLAKGKYLYLLNSDTLLLNDACKLLYDAHESIDNVGILCANLFDKELKPNHTYGMVLPTLFSLFLYRFGLMKFFPRLNEKFNHSYFPRKVKQIVGANMFLRRDLFLESGGFDVQFFMYVEDTELSYRISRKGLDLINIPEAKVVHLQGASSQNTNYLEREINSYIYYFLKHKSLNYVRIYLILEVFQVFNKRLIFFILGSDRYKYLVSYLVKKFRSTYSY